MKTLKRALIVASCGLLWSGSGEAQQLPFDRIGEDRAQTQYRALLLTQFRETLDEWTRAVNAGDIEAAAGLYAGDALLYMGEVVRGGPAIHEVLTRHVDGLRGLRVNLSEFEGSNRVTYGSANVRLPGSAADGKRSGTMVVVMQREGRDTWKIRSQTMLFD